MTKADMIKLGWHTYYSESYWCHPDLVEDKSRQDYTNYGVSFEDAVKLEALGRPKFKFTGIPALSMMLKNKEFTSVS